jgi:cation transport regulator ChaC
VTLVPIDEYKDVKETYEDHFNINDQEELITWGMAYRIPKSKKEEVKHHLDYREKNGYSCYTVDIFHPDKAEPVVKNVFLLIILIFKI